MDRKSRTQITCDMWWQYVGILHSFSTLHIAIFFEFDKPRQSLISSLVQLINMVDFDCWAGWALCIPTYVASKSLSIVSYSISRSNSLIWFKEPISVQCKRDEDLPWEVMYILKMEICFQYIFLYPFSHPFPLLFIMDHFFLFSMKSINRYKWKYAMCSCSGINHKKSKSVKQTWKGAEISVPGTGEICEESRQTPQCLCRTHH
jgi:hypothetical protein